MGWRREANSLFNSLRTSKDRDNIYCVVYDELVVFNCLGPLPSQEPQISLRVQYELDDPEASCFAFFALSHPWERIRELARLAVEEQRDNATMSSDQWINRTEIRSETSNRIYVISQHRTKRHWACSCPAYRTRRACKHLRAAGLPEHEVPFEMAKKNDFMGVYDKTYDRRQEGPGSPDEWRRKLEEQARQSDKPEPLNLPKRKIERLS